MGNSRGVSYQKLTFSAENTEINRKMPWGVRKKSPSPKSGAGVKFVALETDFRREQDHQLGDLPISSGNRYGAWMLCVGDRVSRWTARATAEGYGY